ncbi:MAG: thioesterase family protein [Clostridium sp.]|jgi:predicted thioesterase|uniref:thioesterase family protein n=1 Tax=Clostridium sp. TaxID=1506 RepID=UPI0025C14731|nr:thioesterase family protein [Clostridium sp.]MCH3965632.1 thioesterase family protein [Clostridium sp.]MCI1717141.1 thioesterase family protein [Clostridium sp.]MCI1801454.1 thioesterase family protein [Clostridium sp.]MCI1815327.1 thioesterase family protein [Clostridium sp.]MCI1872203.1 thioesterase family protein [Clostridium sp.]
MEFNLKEGISLIKEMKVTKDDTAIKMGSGTLEVYATPSMAALMENAASNSVIEGLPEGYTTVGISIDIKHIKSSPVGANIKCKATLTKVEGKKLFFDVEASDDAGIIGKGSHVRYIVNASDFMKKTNNG